MTLVVESSDLTKRFGRQAAVDAVGLAVPLGAVHRPNGSGRTTTRSLPGLSGSDNLHRIDAAERTVNPRTAGVRVPAVPDRVGLGAAAGNSD